MKKILFIVAAALLCMSCEDFLDTENLRKKDTSNFPKTAEDADQMITGVYASLSRVLRNVHNSYHFVAELAADDRFGGGGENDMHFQAVDKLMNVGPDQYKSYWEDRYQGIFRANMALETLDNCEVNETALNNYKAEVHFLRAFSYHELAEMFGEVPLVLATAPENLPRADVDLVYGQIAYDLKQAIERFPSVKYNAVESGHATKWAAQALMARVFLFYTGFYGKSDMPLGDGAGENVGSISKSEVTSWIEDCIANSGHDLIDDYRRIWAYSNQYTAPEYDYVKDLAESGRTWVVDGNNPEHVFVVKCSKMAGWGDQTHTGYSNMYLLFNGLRADNGKENTFPFGQGWGAGPVNPKLWTEWATDEPNDMRRKASIIDIAAETKGFILGADKQIEEAGYFVKKLIPFTAHDSEGALKTTFAYLQWNTSGNDIALHHMQDHIVIRFSDVLLMHSELTGSATNMNKVRARVGLPSVEYSLEKLKKERRYELCFEGRRWADIRRWGDASAALAKQENVDIFNKTVPKIMKRFAGGYAKRYEETKGFWPLPTSDVELSDGVLTQTPGWGAEYEYTGWGN